MENLLFDPIRRTEIADGVRKYLNSAEDYLSATAVKSTRAVGDAIQEVVAGQLGRIFGDDYINYRADFPRRAMEDVAFEDKVGRYYAVDVKTYRRDTEFNMPNLISVEHLTRFYQKDTNHFVLLVVSYEIEGIKAVIRDVLFLPIEYVGWDCLTLGALGWGQIQIARSDHITVNEDYSRKTWMLELCERMLTFYPAEIAKIEKRVAYFQKAKARWEGQ